MAKKGEGKAHTYANACLRQLRSVCFTIRPVKAVHPVGAIIAGVLSAWASFNFLRGSLTGAPPMYSHGWVQRGLHFIAGIIFASLAVAAVFMLVGKW